jgi:Domain of unknown function (DUF4157)
MKCRVQRKTSANQQHVAADKERKLVPTEGELLDAGTRGFMESRFGHDFGEVRVHAGPEDAKSAAALSAEAYTLGPDIVFGGGRYAPQSREGRSLLAHELAHVVQQGGGVSGPPGASRPSKSLEAEADGAAAAVTSGARPSVLGSTGRGMVQRKVEMRDVATGGESGFARLPELVARLNGISHALTYTIEGKKLTYKQQSGATTSDFDTKMMSFIDQGVVIPLILANHKQNIHISVDDYKTGTVDMDDILAADDLNLQIELVHFLTERTATKNYASRIGPDAHIPMEEFKAAHAKGLTAETELLRNFFIDYSIVFDHPGPQPVSRTFKNERGDQIQVLHASTDGLDVYTTRVTLLNGQTMTALEYKDLLAKERTARQIEAQRVRANMTEYREGGRSVPSP